MLNQTTIKVQSPPPKVIVLAESTTASIVRDTFSIAALCGAALFSKWIGYDPLGYVVMVLTFIFALGLLGKKRKEMRFDEARDYIDRLENEYLGR